MIPRRFFWILDFIAVAIAFCVAYESWGWVRLGVQSVQGLPDALRPPPTTGELPAIVSMLRIMLLGGLASIVGLELGKAYSPLLLQTRARVFLYCLIASAGSAFAITFFLFLERNIDWSRLFIVAFMAFNGAILFLFRMSLRHYFRQRRDAGFYMKRVLIVGSRQSVRWLIDYFQKSVARTEYGITGYLSIPGDHDENDVPSQFLGRSDQIGDLLIARAIDEVISVQPIGDASWLTGVIESCDALGILLRIFPESLLQRKLRTLRNLYPYSLLHLPAVVLAPPHFDSDTLFFKRLVDIFVSSILLFLLSPLLAIVALIIKLTDRRSPVFYQWNVVGRNGARFSGYKFTTMYSDADDRRKDLLDKNEMTGPVFKIKKDPRVTPFGRFLRKFSLNELPQLWSVLKGDMSLVGPRPAFPHELDAYEFWHKRKLSIRPGITCLWQTRGRNKISNFDDWVKMDLEYIDNWSLWLDFKILVRTAWVVIAGTGS